MRPVRAIVYGVGAMGSIMARLMLDKGVEIVGAVGRSPEKVGRDLGDVAGLGSRTGVVVEPDARPALDRGADIAVVTSGQARSAETALPMAPSPPNTTMRTRVAEHNRFMNAGPAAQIPVESIRPRWYGRPSGENGTCGNRRWLKRV
jgi:hypothetical protein